MTGVTFSMGWESHVKTGEQTGGAHRRLGRRGRLDGAWAVLRAFGAEPKGLAFVVEYSWHVGYGVLDQNFFELTSYCGLHLKLVSETAA